LRVLVKLVRKSAFHAAGSHMSILFRVAGLLATGLLLLAASASSSRERIQELGNEHITQNLDGTLLRDGVALGSPNTSSFWHGFLSDHRVAIQSSDGHSLVDYAPIRLRDGLLLVVSGGNSVHMPRAVSELVDLSHWAPSGRSPRKQPEVQPGPLPNIARLGGAAALLHDGRVLVVGGGGRFPEYEPVTVAEIYDPKADRFAAIPSQSMPRRDFEATTMEDGRVLLTGGIGDGSRIQMVDRAEIFDPRLQKFTPVGTLLCPRYHHAAVSLPDGRVMIVGGLNLDPQATKPLLIEYFNPGTNRFEAGGALPSPINAPMAMILASGDVLLSGGLTWQTRSSLVDGRPSSMEGYFPNETSAVIRWQALRSEDPAR
jgi:hypothetical protein